MCFFVRETRTPCCGAQPKSNPSLVGRRATYVAGGHAKATTTHPGDQDGHQLTSLVVCASFSRYLAMLRPLLTLLLEFPPSDCLNLHQSCCAVCTPRDLALPLAWQRAAPCARGAKRLPLERPPDLWFAASGRCLGAPLSSPSRARLWRATATSGNKGVVHQ